MLSFWSDYSHLRIQSLSVLYSYRVCHQLIQVSRLDTTWLTKVVRVIILLDKASGVGATFT